MFVSKRVLLIVGVVVVIVMLGVGVGVAYAFNALSQQTTTNASPKATVTAQVSVSPTAGAQNKNGQRRVVGVIQALSAQSFMLVVTTKKAKHEITVDVNAQTKYAHAGKAAAFSDLQVGETVAVQGAIDSATLMMQATRVMILPKVATPQPAASPIVTPTP
ncbi:MAG TPA: DUF5666 domain-containing protein [Ktedonobacteraceae bacterium]|nr:DUF5666 domain-containing protein [Ktedonobacteraceae bacterium]